MFLKPAPNIHSTQTVNKALLTDRQRECVGGGGKGGRMRPTGMAGLQFGGSINMVL